MSSLVRRKSLAQTTETQAKIAEPSLAFLDFFAPTWDVRNHPLPRQQQEVLRRSNEYSKDARLQPPPFAIPHSPFPIRHSPFAIPHSSFPIRHSPFVIRHSSFAIRHSPFAIPQAPPTEPISKKTIQTFIFPLDLFPRSDILLTRTLPVQPPPRYPIRPPTPRVLRRAHPGTAPRSFDGLFSCPSPPGTVFTRAPRKATSGSLDYPR